MGGALWFRPSGGARGGGELPVVASRFVFGGQPALDPAVLADLRLKTNHVGKFRRSFKFKGSFRLDDSVTPALVRVEDPKGPGGYRLLPRGHVMVRAVANGPIPSSHSGFIDAKGGGQGLGSARR